MKKRNTPVNPHNEWFSANGDQDWNSADEWRGADSSWDANGGDRQAVQTHSSAPYILQIVNACTSAIADVDIGDAARNRTSATFNLNSNITVTSTVQGINYLEYLAMSESQPFLVGATMIISTSAGQLDQTVKITHRNPSGDDWGHVITPTLTLNQNQTDRVIDDYEYLMTSMTRLRWNQINASATVTCRQYLKGKFAANQILVGRPALQGYGQPNVVANAKGIQTLIRG